MVYKAFRFPDATSSGGAQSAAASTKGRPPAKATVGTLTPAQGKLIGRWTLPNDAVLTTVLGYSVAVSVGDPVVFPVGASPDDNLGKVTKWQVEDYPVGQLVDAWVVTSDKYGNPTAPGAGNALYLGRGKISNTKKTTIVGADVT